MIPGFVDWNRCPSNACTSGEIIYFSKQKLMISGEFGMFYIVIHLSYAYTS